ncbi:MAG: PKD domain-containing protein, partial [Nanoarchaeota archaeon]|nr:PKD domain-containing protein [Nanoarchaeota archaeon]
MRKTYLGVMVVVLLLLNIVFVSADVFINEVMYNPTGTDTGHEWIEIYNNGSDSFNISAWKLYEGSTNHGLTLVQGTDNLSAESYAIIASDDAIFIADYPAFAGNLFDSAFSSGLSNSGEELTIKNSSLDIMDSIVYSNSWGDNEGYSLELINPSLDNNLSGSWRNSLILNGTPGQQNSVYDTGNPVANFTPQESIIEGQYALFNSSLSYDDSYISNYQWNFSDNNVTNTSSSAIYHKFLQNGTYNVNLTVADKVGFTDSMSKQIIVNDAVPVANFILSNSTPQEDQSITFTNSSTSYDPIISLFWQFGDDGTTAATQNVSHIFTKDGVYEVNLTVMDDDGSVSIISNNITVSYVNDAPVITTASINATLEDSNYTYDVNAIDEEGDNLTYSLAVYPSGMVINSTDGMIRWLPTNSGVGLHNVIVNVSDVFGAYTIQSYVLNVTNINDDPVLGAVGNKTIVQDSKLTIQLSSSDIDPTNDTLTYSITSSLGTLNTTSGLFEWTPDYTYYGPYEVNFKVIDGNGGQDNETIAVYVYPTLNISAVSVNSQSITDGGIIQNIKPGDSISTSVTVNNLVSGLNLDDVNITLESIDFKVAKIESVGILSGASSSTKTI